MEGIFAAWGRILAGHTPSLSIEITRDCPLRCPGCYAYGSDHLGGDINLRQLDDFKGQELVDKVLALIRTHKPVHVSIVGGEPLVRFRELNTLLPAISALGIHTQLVTSAVRPIPAEWADIHRLSIVVSIDGLQPEHDERRTPATYDRVLKHIAGHQVTVHWTITRQQASRDRYLEAFVDFWSAQRTTRRIWASLYTPQVGELSAERLRAADRQRAIEELSVLRPRYPKLELPSSVLEVYRNPPESPEGCIFAKTTAAFSADLDRRITPCQFGGNPDCASCGCIASAALGAVGRHRLPGGTQVATIFEASLAVGRTVRRLREAVGG